MTHVYFINRTDTGSFRVTKDNEVIVLATTVETINMVVAGIHFTHMAKDENFDVTLLGAETAIIAGNWIEIPRTIKG